MSKAAGVLTLNSLRVHSASVNIEDGVAISEFVVSPHFGSPPAAGLLRQQLIRALGRADRRVEHAGGARGRDAPQARRRGADRGSRSLPDRPTADLVVRRHARPIDHRNPRERPPWTARAAHRRAGAGRGDIDWAKVTTRGSMVDDVFCIVLPARSAAAKAAGEPGSSTRSAIEHHLLAVLESPKTATAPPSSDRGSSATRRCARRRRATQVRASCCGPCRQRIPRRSGKPALSRALRRW